MLDRQVRQQWGVKKKILGDQPNVHCRSQKSRVLYPSINIKPSTAIYLNVRNILITQDSNLIYLRISGAVLYEAMQGF